MLCFTNLILQEKQQEPSATRQYSLLILVLQDSTVYYSKCYETVQSTNPSATRQYSLLILVLRDSTV